MSNQQEEQKIRNVIGTWVRSTAEGDIDKVLTLMAEDVVFLQPGHEPIRGREAFAALSRGAIGKVRFEGKPEIREIQIAGDFAYCWNYMTVTITPLPNGPTKQRAGNILSVFRKEPNGNWVLYRDANMLTAI